VPLGKATRKKKLCPEGAKRSPELRAISRLDEKLFLVGNFGGGGLDYIDPWKEFNVIPVLVRGQRIVTLAVYIWKNQKIKTISESNVY